MDSAVVRRTNNQGLAREWTLVLMSAGIVCDLEPCLEGWELRVAANDVPPAAAALDSYDHENAGRSAEGTARSVEYGPTWAGYAVACALVAFHLSLATTPGGIRWIDQGSAYARRILDGEVWRAVTALTLHVGVAHVASNAVAGAVFVTAVCRALGPGVGVWLVLLAGAIGNWLNAVLQGPPHSAVGASTAIFGAVGALGVLQFSKRARVGGSTRRAWIPIAAALALLALLGTGPESDVVAHLLGFAVGGLLGLTSALALPEPPAAGLQWLLVFAAVAAVVSCWGLALM